MADTLFGRFTIIGAGLMGTSLALALRQTGVVTHVELYDRSPEALKAAARRHAAHGYEHDLATAVRDAGAICLATPVGTFADLVAGMASHLAPGVVVTDLGSVKSVMRRAALPDLPGHAVLVPAHPLAGSEKAGADAADAALFHGALVLLTPDKEAPREAVERIRALWHAVGAETREMPADVHDAALAWTSHLPQVAASALASVLGQRADAWGESLYALSGRGLDDTTRLAASDPDMWADILDANRAHVHEAVVVLRACLDELAAALARGDRAGAHRLVESGRTARRRYEAGRAP